MSAPKKEVKLGPSLEKLVASPVWKDFEAALERSLAREKEFDDLEREEREKEKEYQKLKQEREAKEKKSL
jgi:Skp family chaperone for outer membrane proteins